MDLNLVLIFLSFIFSLAAIFLGVWTAGRLTGKLRTAAIFLIATIIIFVVTMIVEITNLPTTINLTLIKNIAYLGIILLILLSILSMKRMIDDIDANYKKK